MIRQIYNKLEKFTKPGYLILGIILVVFFNIFLFPGFPKWFGINIPVENILDLKLFYTPETVYTFFDDLGEKGREVYRYSEMFIDLSYMIIYTLFYSALIVKLLNINRLKSKKWILWIPLLLGIFDLLENSGIIALITAYPDQQTNLVKLTSVFTSLKWTFALLTFLSIVTLFLRWVLIRKKLK